MEYKDVLVEYPAVIGNEENVGTVFVYAMEIEGVGCLVRNVTVADCITREVHFKESENKTKKIRDTYTSYVPGTTIERGERIVSETCCFVPGVKLQLAEDEASMYELVPIIPPYTE